MSMESYVSEFLNLTNRLESMTEREKMFFFSEGLPEYIKKELVFRDIEIVEDAIPFVIKMETASTNTPKINFVKTNFKKKYSPATNNKSNKQDFTNKKPITYNTHQKAPNKSVKADVTCLRCKKKGHYANKCRVVLKKVNHLEILSDHEEKIYMISSFDDNLNSIPATTGYVGGIKLKLGIDCGATHSVMNHMTAIKNNFDILPCNSRVKTATGAISYASGKTKPIEVVLGDSKCLMEFVVFDHDDNDILLGLDWFRKTNAGIFPSLGVIKFPDSEFKINQCNNTYHSSDIFDVFFSESNPEMSDDYFPRVTYLSKC